MARRLVTQSFCEMMLCSKASKNEDRFYAILPQTKYKDKTNQVPDWNINNMTSIKLKLFEILDTKDKLTLLFLAGFNRSSSRFELTADVLPTFATSSVSKSACNYFAADYPLNFDLDNKSTITLHPHARDSHLSYFLQLTPKTYSVADLSTNHPDYIDSSRGDYLDELADAMIEKTRNYLQLSTPVCIVCISYFDTSTSTYWESYRTLMKGALYLAGSFRENKWTLIKPYALSDEDLFDRGNKNGTVFNIY
ncbi:hypothetical protein BCR42DRAFT_426173 [Absidia repens]|uniref:Uncharacterized protein n=1 Tax=Absidia repens TaxID=90262 RepID=A0A1X2I1U2_9FUNG|nr:hypothetical protein BCR42DRAFT_426173 [Absidia repens]